MENITGIILAGGKSRRMGQDKGFITFKGKTFTEHIIDSFSGITNEVIIVSNNPAYDTFNIKRVVDEVENFGPVAGIYSGIKSSNTNWNIIVSCDSPLVDEEVWEELLKHQNKDVDLVQFIGNGKTTPTIALYNKRCFHIFKQAIENKTHKLNTVTQKIKQKNIEVCYDIQQKIVNFNLPEDLKKHMLCV